MEQKDLEIALLTEPHTICNKLHSFPRGTTLVYDRSIPRDKAAPRAAIVASRSLGITALEQWCRRDCAAACVKLDGRQTIIASVYLDIKQSARPDWLDGLLNMAARKSYPIILCVDTNAHSSLYGPSNNARGNDIEDLVLHHGLEVANRGEAPTFETRRGDKLIQTHIDLSLIHI